MFCRFRKITKVGKALTFRRTLLMGAKITIIGAGNVGSTIAFALSDEDLASEIVLIDINKNKVEGEAMDIVQGTYFRDPISVIAGEYEDAKGSDIVIITSGVARKPGQTRIDLAQINLNIIKSITPEIVSVCPDALYVIVSNPMDIMTYAFTKYSGLPERQIIGSGTILDTARLRYALSEHYGVSQRSIHAYVFGEHGDTSFIPWSRAFVSCVHIDEYHRLMAQKVKTLKPLDKDYMLEYVRNSGAKIIKNKGATFYAIAQTVAQLCSILLASCDSIQMVSSMMHGEYGIKDVCLSTLTLVGPQGIHGKVPMDLTYEEIRMLNASAESLKAVISKLEF